MLKLIEVLFQKLSAIYTGLSSAVEVMLEAWYLRFVFTKVHSHKNSVFCKMSKIEETKLTVIIYVNIDSLKVSLRIRWRKNDG